ncbi:MAG: RagB/SusD family nutrient uptake outer membrane protein, partial [Pedobacter sp.]
MKTNFKIIFFAAALLAVSCKKSFLDNPSETGPTTENYYTTAAQVNGATGLLYNSVWNDWSDK